MVNIVCPHLICANPKSRNASVVVARQGQRTHCAPTVCSMVGRIHGRGAVGEKSGRPCGRLMSASFHEPKSMTCAKRSVASGGLPRLRCVPST